MDRRTFLKASIASTAAAGLASASGQAYAQAGKPPTIAFFVKNVTNPFWKACRIGAEKAAKDLGVALEVVAPTKPDNIEEQTRLVEDWIVRKPDAFVFVPVDYKALVPSIQKANKAGIPVVNYNNKMADIQAVSYIGSDDEVMEYEICTYLFKSMGGKGKVVHIDGVPAAITAQARKRGFERAVKAFPGIEVLASQPGQYRRLPAVQVFENLMQRFPEIDAVVSANDDMAVGIAEALAAAGRLSKTKVIGIDGIPDATAAIAAGKMFATADFSGHDQSYLAVTAAVRHLRKQPVPREIQLPIVIIDKSNVQQFMKTPEERAVPNWDKTVAARKS
ncbi:MAG: sugar ABC transporter substrate-binding protein [Betaproteobacteria bacterium]|nr:MAG: sugar ABC transporter substrate-binding protein [Betaproteobacteria bacterium]